ncbi:DEAD/DEAH box helicase [Anabaena sphaerica FACHB-251]|uniref:site-specific DNA-methyltransferase (adenine-specific) n=1 Tax=Anabaena sphaerica FACHB-251 TaxID=2692883 RepID=A0A926WHL4_9NOST|nr:type ISP restriction/modification enzyme [Anabaena sphaerica]MBD2294302.1 DEAD/DEAH box helicase [Anabaena sphaerica FACHB-251]
MSSLNLKPTHKPIKQYYEELENFKKLGVVHETAVKAAFQKLLESCCQQFKWTLVQEYAIKRPKKQPLRVDGALVDDFNLPRAYWEAKDSKDNLKKEVQKKLAVDYPKDNIIFQQPERAILYQDGKLVMDEDITNPQNLVDVVRQFFEYRPPAIEQWEKASNEFGFRVKENATALLELIREQSKKNKKFIDAFAEFLQLCRQSINPNLSEAAVEEMLIQHLLTERIFRSVFNNPDFAQRNIIAVEIEKVINALTSKSFSRSHFLSSLDRFYGAIEETAATIDNFSQKQDFLNKIYERFFQGFSVKVADTHGIVYTPQPIVNFMVKSVEDILQREFGKSLVDKGVHILDPFVGTGNFIIRIMREIAEIQKSALPYKYEHELHCNEVMLLPYYIASMNIEHEYFEQAGEYKSFEGICLVDTFDLAEAKQLSLALFSTENTKRVERQKQSPIFVIIGNPPYNAYQSEDINNRNRKYLVMDKRVSETYSKDSKATNKNALSDPYVKAIRWASDRLKNDGVVAFVTNSSFLDKLAFDGMRKHLQNDFDNIYIFNLQGDIRKDSMRDGIPLGEQHTVFGLAAMVGVSITFLVRKTGSTEHKIFYHEVDFRATRKEKFEIIEKLKTVVSTEWKELQPDNKNNWLTDDLKDEYQDFTPLGTKEAKATDGIAAYAIFKLYSGGVKTSRDAWAYNFNADELAKNMQKTIDFYNDHIFRWKNRKDREISINNFVNLDDHQISWSDGLRTYVKRETCIAFEERYLRHSLYRPFTNTFLYFDRHLNERRYQFPSISPTSQIEEENCFICVTGLGAQQSFATLFSNKIPDLNFLGIGTVPQWFSFYTYHEDGTNRQENITDWVLKQYQNHYQDETITKWDIFYYIYAVLHHPHYRERYAANLKRELPRIPFAPEFHPFATAGKRLAEIHVNYEKQPEYRLKHLENKDLPIDWRVEKMRLSKDKTQIKYNDFLTLTGIPPEVFAYRLGNRSALDWIIDQYQVTTDKRSGITNDPNRLDDEEYIVRLIKQVITVSLETVEIVNNLPDLGLVKD